jgi:aspartyl/glutamyl-tRNA(Asn/Gln) amidotransferase C subunit
MTETLSKTLSDGRLTELFQLAKLTTLSLDEELLDKSYLESMIASAAKIDAIDADDLRPATHAFDVEQRLRVDEVTETGDHREIYQKLAPAMLDGLYSVPAVIE